MGRLSTYIAMRKDLEFDYEREVRTLRDLLGGVMKIEGREQGLMLGINDGFVAGSHARSIFVQELQTTLRDLLLHYLRNLCLEAIQLGVSSSLLEAALKAEETQIEADSLEALGLETPPTMAAFASADSMLPPPLPEGDARHLQQTLAAALAA